MCLRSGSPHPWHWVESSDKRSCVDSLSQSLQKVLSSYNEYVGTYALMVLLVPVGLLFTAMLKGVQVTRLRHAIDIVRGKKIR